jgi:AraC-like DNA-binding protein
MSNSVITLSSLSLPASQRTQYWAGALAKLCGPLYACPLGTSALDGHINYTNLSRLTLCHIEVSRHRIALPAEWAKFGEHPVVKVLFQTQGTSIFEQDGRSITIEAGDCLAYDVSRPHVITSEQFTRHDVVIVPKALARQRGLAPLRMPPQKFSARCGAPRLAHEFMLSVFKEVSKLSPAAELDVASTLLDLLTVPMRETSRSFGQLDANALRARAKAFIEANLSDPGLTIEQIAADVGCTKRYLHLLFSDEGITLSQYILHARLENCRRELASASDAQTLTEIAFSWGFSSSSHFSRIFKKLYGVPPSVFRTRDRIM